MNTVSSIRRRMVKREDEDGKEADAIQTSVALVVASREMEVGYERNSAAVLKWLFLVRMSILASFTSSPSVSGMN